MQGAFPRLLRTGHASWRCASTFFSSQLPTYTCQIRRSRRAHQQGIVRYCDETHKRRKSSFVKPRVDIPKSRERCPMCGDAKLIKCKDCKGSGKLAVGGYQKRNPLKLDTIIGSKWTAMETTFGWRHFRAMQKRRKGKDTYLLMTATCDETTQFWLNAKLLRNRSQWACGWLRKSQLNALQEGPPCKACAGNGKVQCPTCS